MDSIITSLLPFIIGSAVVPLQIIVVTLLLTSARRGPLKAIAFVLGMTLARLAQGPATVKELAEPFNISLPAISKHLKVLEHAGLIERGREPQWRPARLQAAPLKDVAQWLELYRQNWEESFDRLDEYLRRIQKEKA